MTCMEARNEMLIVDLETLRADSGEGLGLHLATCAQCRALAAAIVAETAALGAMVHARRRSTRQRRTRTIAWISALPIAAAVLAAVVLNGRSNARDGIAAVDRLPAARHVSFDVAPGQQATMLKTADPNVTLIWLTPGVGQ